MARSARGFWSTLPPIDIEAIAQQRQAWRGARKLTVEQVARIQEAKKRNKKKRKRAAMARVEREKAERWFAGRDTNITEKMLAAMEPGHWYGRADVVAASGVKRDSVQARMRDFELDGWVERAINPDWKPGKLKPIVEPKWVASGDNLIAGNALRAPKILFRLTPRGERERARRAYLA